MEGKGEKGGQSDKGVKEREGGGFERQISLLQ